MTHPLLVLARAYDASYVNEDMESTLAEDTTAALDSGEIDTAVCAYAAHFAVLTQTFQLGKYGVYEEPQTDALFGLLTGSFWHASILAEAYNASEAGNNASKPLNLKRWVHQKKKDEAAFGYDFGILVDLGDNRIKVTLFQAKRPEEPEDANEISIKRPIRGSTGTKVPSNFENLYTLIEQTEESIKSFPTDVSDSKKQQLVDRLDELKKFTLPECQEYYVMRQRDAITSIKDDIVDQDYSKENVRQSLELTTLPQWASAEEKEEARRVKELREGAFEKDYSLFRYPYAYEQSDAFLATALHGWCDDAAEYPPDWCFYVQWTNQNAGFPWCLPIEIALKMEAYQDSNEFVPELALFSKTLTSALSIHDEKVGWIINKNNLEATRRAISKINPHIMWATISDSKKLGKELLMSLGLDESEISDPAEYNLDRTPGNDTTFKRTY